MDAELRSCGVLCPARRTPAGSDRALLAGCWPPAECAARDAWLGGERLGLLRLASTAPV